MCAVDVAGPYKISGGGFTLVRFTSIHAGKTDTGGVTPRRPLSLEGVRSRQCVCHTTRRSPYRAGRTAYGPCPQHWGHSAGNLATAFPCGCSSTVEPMASNHTTPDHPRSSAPWRRVHKNSGGKSSPFPYFRIPVRLTAALNGDQAAFLMPM